MSDGVQRLLARLDLDPSQRDRFVGHAGPGGRGHRERLYGGLVAAQAYIAAARTADVGPIHSLHLYFLRPGESSVPIRYEVERIKEGKRIYRRDGRRVASTAQEGAIRFESVGSARASKEAEKR